MQLCVDKKEKLCYFGIFRFNILSPHNTAESTIMFIILNYKSINKDVFESKTSLINPFLI